MFTVITGGPPVRGRSAAETERRCVPISPAESAEPDELGYARVGRKVAGNSSKSFKMVIASVSNRAGHRKIQNGFLEIPPPHTLTFPLRECHSKSPIQWGISQTKGAPPASLFTAITWSRAPLNAPRRRWNESVSRFHRLNALDQMSSDMQELGGKSPAAHRNT